MNLTNKTGLPEPLYLAIKNDDYSAGESDISTTSLSVPSRIWALRQKHRDEIVTDAADRIWSLIGQIGHKIMERCGSNPRYVTEKRYYVTIDGVVIGGQVDLYDTQDKTLEDYKVTSCYAVKEGVKDEWTEQGNVNKYLLEHQDTPIEVRRIKYHAILRDWSKSKAGNDGVPDQGVVSFEVSRWPEEVTLAWIKGRIRSHYAALEALPDCTPEERWAKKNQWAVMKKGQKRAVKLYDFKDEAEMHVKGAGESNGFYMQYRPGEDVRCLNYCEVSMFCQYAKERGYV